MVPVAHEAAGGRLQLDAMSALLVWGCDGYQSTRAGEACTKTRRIRGTSLIRASVLTANLNFSGRYQAGKPCFAEPQGINNSTKSVRGKGGVIK